MELLWDTSCVWGTCMLGLWLKKASWLRGRETFLDVEESLLWIHTIKQRGQQNPHDKHAVNTAEEQVLLQKQKPIRRQADSLNSRAELNPMQKLTCLDHNPRKKDFYQMCLNKSLLLFLTCVKGKIYFAPERKKILHFLLNSPVNQEKPETSAWWPIAFILFAKLKGGLRFFWGGLCWMWAIQCKGTLRRQAGTYRGPKVGCMPRTLSPRAEWMCTMALSASHCDAPAGQHKHPQAKD